MMPDSTRYLHRPDELHIVDPSGTTLKPGYLFSESGVRVRRPNFGPSLRICMRGSGKVTEANIQQMNGGTADRVYVGPWTIGGRGVFAARYFSTGEMIAPIVTVREISADSLLRENENREHCTYVDGRVLLVAEPLCFTNHSSDPNAYESFNGMRSNLKTRRHVAEGEEITVDYLINNECGDCWVCRCGATRCRGETEPSFFHLPIAIQREYAPLLAEWLIRKHERAIAALIDQ